MLTENSVLGKYWTCLWANNEAGQTGMGEWVMRQREREKCWHTLSKKKLKECRQNRKDESLRRMMRKDLKVEQKWRGRKTRNQTTWPWALQQLLIKSVYKQAKLRQNTKTKVKKKKKFPFLVIIHIPFNIAVITHTSMQSF